MNVFFAHSGGRHNKRSVFWLHLIALLRVYECVCVCVCVCLIALQTATQRVCLSRQRGTETIKVCMC